MSAHDELRICLMCTHFSLHLGSDGYSEWTPGGPGHACCNKYHWDLDSEYDCTKDFRAVMTKAKDCKDFEKVKL